MEVKVASIVLAEAVTKFDILASTSTAGVARRAHGSAPTDALAIIGIALASGSPGDTIAYQTGGWVLMPSATWLKGFPVYLGSGVLTQTAPTPNPYTLQVGTALSATSVSLDFSQAATVPTINTAPLLTQSISLSIADFTVDGGDNTKGNCLTSITLPAGAILARIPFKITTGFTTAATPTLSIGINGGSATGLGSAIAANTAEDSDWSVVGSAICPKAVGTTDIIVTFQLVATAGGKQFSDIVAGALTVAFMYTNPLLLS